MFIAKWRSCWLAGRETRLCEGSLTLCSRSCHRAKFSDKTYAGCDRLQLSFVVERQCQLAVAIAVNLNLVRPAINAMK